MAVGFWGDTVLSEQPIDHVGFGHGQRLATLWEERIVDSSLVLEWAGAVFTWKLIGPVLVQARDVFGSDRLWTGFEALAEAQAAL